MADMIERVVIQNFRCFKRLDVGLRPLTVAIGRNDTGKTTFLDALELAATNHGSWGGGWGDSFHQQRVANPTIHFTDRRLRRLHRMNLPVSGPQMRASGQPDQPTAPPMEQGVPVVVDWLLRKDRKRYDRLVEAIRASIPGVADVQVAFPSASERRLDLVGEGGWTRPADQGSAGVKLMLYFLVLAWHPDPPDLVLVEEPETGLHPARLQEVVGLLRGLPRGEHAPNAVQVVLTTHSPYLLDFVDPAEDQVLVFERDEDGSCSAQPLARDRIQPFLRDFGLGEIWTNEGEEALVGRP